MQPTIIEMLAAERLREQGKKRQQGIYHRDLRRTQKPPHFWVRLMKQGV